MSRRLMVHRRAPPTVNVPLDKLRVPFEFEPDPLHHAKIMRSMTGRSPVALTRLPTDWITEGFYHRREGKAVHVTEPRFHSGKDLFVARIRGGHRPEVEVYWSPLSPKARKYVAPDAEPILLAYREVGLKQVPVRILDCDAARLRESAVLIYEAGKNAGFARAIAVKRKSFSSLLGRRSIGPVDDTKRLIEACSILEEAITAFHRPFDEISYHQTIRAQVRRHREILDSIRALLELGRADHCLALVRLLYEGFLNHYLDWLSPEFFGPRLHALSEFRRFQAEERRKGRPCKDARIRSALKGLLPLLETVEQKARLSPLGDLFHRIAYPPLSFIVHQDYGEKAASLDDAEPDKGSSTREDVVVSWADAITGSLVDTIQGDIAGSW